MIQDMRKCNVTRDWIRGPWTEDRPREEGSLLNGYGRPTPGDMQEASVFGGGGNGNVTGGMRMDSATSIDGEEVLP